MSTHPRHAAPKGGAKGTAHALATLKRQVKQLQSKPSAIEELDGAVLTPGSVTSDEIAAGTITGDDIAADTITGGNISADTITSGNIAADTITSGDIAANAITTNELAANSVTATQISANSITASALQANSVTAAAIQAGTITSSLIQSGTIVANNIAAGAITGDRIAAGTITASNIQSGTITATQITAGTITATQIAADTITSAKIAANTITAADIAANTITAGQIAAATITGDRVAATTITGSNIAGTTITGSNMVAGTITATQIAAGTITSSLLASNSVTSTQIVSGAVTSTKISVSNLAAISADMGAITAGTITGGTIRTAASGARVQMDTTGVFAKDTSNVDTFRIDAATGNVTLKGTLTTGSSIDAGSITSGTLGASRIPSIGGGNQIYDSSFESGVNSWDGATAIITAADAKHGARYLRWTVPGGAGSKVHQLNKRVFAKAGSTYVVSAWVRGPVTSSGALRLWRYADSTTSTLIAESAPNPSVSLPASWTRFVATWVATADEWIEVGFRTSTGSASGDLIDLDAIQWEEGEVVTSYAPRPDEILPGSIGTVQIAANAVTTAEIAVDTITASNIAANAITVSELASNSVTSAKIVANTILASNIAAGAITSTEIAASTITGAKIAATTIAAGNIVTGTITGTQIAANTITAAKILADTITATEIAAGAISASELAANSVIAGKILAGTIVTADIAAGGVNADRLVAGSVTAAQIAANTITAAKLNFTVGGRNLLPDSSFEQNYAVRTNDYGASTRQTTGGRATNTACWQVTANASGQFRSYPSVTTDWAIVQPGKTYIGTSYVKRNSGTGGTVQAYLQFRDSSTTAIVPDGGLGSAVTLSTDYQRVATAAAAAPSNAMYVRMIVQHGTVTSNAATIRVDDEQIEEGDVPGAWTPYINPTTIDGSTVTAGTFRTAASGARAIFDTTSLRWLDSSGVQNLSIDPTNGMKLYSGAAFSAPAALQMYNQGGTELARIYSTDLSGSYSTWVMSKGGANLAAGTFATESATSGAAASLRAWGSSASTYTTLYVNSVSDTNTNVQIYTPGLQSTLLNQDGNAALPGALSLGSSSPPTTNLWTTSTIKAIDAPLGGGALGLNLTSPVVYMSGNAYYNGSWRYRTANSASMLSVGPNFTEIDMAASGAADAAITWTTRLYLDASGNLGLSRTPGGSYTLEVSGSAWASGSFVNGSDVRLKTNIKTVGSALSKIKQIRGVSFTRVHDEKRLKGASGEDDLGVIAQEIRPVFPELVDEDTEGYLGVRYTGLIAPLIESVKELDNNQSAAVRLLHGIVEDIAAEIGGTKGQRILEKLKAREEAMTV